MKHDQSTAPLENILDNDDDEYDEYESLEIPGSSDQVRIDRVLSILTGCSRARAVSEIDAGNVRVGGRAVTTRSQKLRTGNTLSFPKFLLITPEKVLPQGDPNVAVNVVYSDAEVIVINKDAGVVVHPGVGSAEGTLASGLLAHFPELATIGDPVRPGIVHRLDRPTSGLMVVARNEIGYISLSKQLKEHTSSRRYVALVHGLIEPTSATLDGPIGKSRKGFAKMEVSSQGKYARTRYDVVATVRFNDQDYSLVIATLETGRTHQIRVHLSTHGNPIVGDSLYGSKFDFGPRIALHAFELSFDHPKSGIRSTFAAAMPEDLVKLMSEMTLVSGSLELPSEIR